LDCASDYANEELVGEGIAAAIKNGVKRSDFFVTSKLWNTFHEAKYVRKACEKTLSDLGLEYLDLYLIHFPIAQKYVDFDAVYPPGWSHPDFPEGPTQYSNATIQETWAEMEKLVEAGLVKNIGVCNFSVSLLGQLVRFAKIQPAVMQFERHPYLSQPRLVAWLQTQGIAMTAFSSFGAAGYYELGFEEEAFVDLWEQKAVTDAAAAHGKSPFQVLLRWSVQSGIAVIPKSGKTSRLDANLDIFDFELTAAEMAAIDSLNCGKRFNDPGVACCIPHFPIYD